MAEVLSTPVEEPPVVMNGRKVTSSLETLLGYRAVTLRNSKERAVFKLQAGICRGMRMENKMLAQTLGFLRECYAAEIELLEAKLPEITEIPALSFTEAKELISKEYSREITDFDDFEPEEEKLL